MNEHIETLESIHSKGNTEAFTPAQSNDFGPVVLIQGQSFTIVSFGLLVGLGAILGLMNTWFYLGAYQVLPHFSQSNQLALALAVGAPVSAYIVTRLLDMKTWLSGEKTFLEYIRTVSFGLWGGLVGGLLILTSFAVATGTSMLGLFDAFALGVPLAQAFGRVGCLNYGCCHGKECSSHQFGITYQNKQTKVLRYDPELKGKRLHPTQMYSIIANLIIYTTMLIIMLNWDSRPMGMMAGVYMTLYGLKRFGVEFLRGEFPRVFFYGLTVWQWFSLSFIGLGLGVMTSVLYAGVGSGAMIVPAGFQAISATAGILVLAATILGLSYGTHGRKLGSW